MLTKFVILFLSLFFNVFGMDRPDKVMPQLVSGFPDEMNKEIFQALLSGKNARDAVKTLRKIMLTSKKNKTMIETFISTNLDFVLESLNKSTGNVFRSINILEEMTFISAQKAHELMTKYKTKSPEQFKKFNKDEDFFIMRAADGDLNAVKKWIDQGTKVNTTGSYDLKRTALMYASQNNRKDTVAYLLQVPEINVNALTINDETALIIASQQGHSEIVKLLLNAPHINVNAIDSFGETALDYATNREVQVALLLAGAKKGEELRKKNKQSCIIS